jgi:RNA polymerase subunit RPABC4/transcription elongation factor Spt4
MPINLASGVTVCLHCGELASEGALFCTKCGYTLPQAGAAPPPPPAAAGGGAPAPSSTLPPPPPGGTVPYPAPTGYAVLASSVPGATAPMAPPPNGKYCVRCRTVISRAAVYCPVCQQPQTP